MTQRMSAHFEKLKVVKASRSASNLSVGASSDLRASAGQLSRDKLMTNES